MVATVVAASEPPRLIPIRKWHTSYLVESNVGMSWIYSMSADGTFQIYRPSRVDGNAYPCTLPERAEGHWCVAKGRLYRSGSMIIAKASNGMDGAFHLDRHGKVCAPPDEQNDFPGQCEDEGRREAMGLFSVHPR